MLTIFIFLVEQLRIHLIGFMSVYNFGNLLGESREIKHNLCILLLLLLFFFLKKYIILRPFLEGDPKKMPK